MATTWRCRDVANGLGITVLIVQVTDAIAMAGMNVAIAQAVATMSAKVRAVDTMAVIVIATAWAVVFTAISCAGGVSFGLTSFAGSAVMGFSWRRLFALVGVRFNRSAALPGLRSGCARTAVSDAS